MNEKRINIIGITCLSVFVILMIIAIFWGKGLKKDTISKESLPEKVNILKEKKIQICKNAFLKEINYYGESNLDISIVRILVDSNDVIIQNCYFE